MKIDAQIIALTNTFVSLERDQETSFDYLLDDKSKEPKSDDYYWQHQNQLQQSDLTFNALKNKPKTQITSSDNQDITQPEQQVADMRLMPEFVHVNVPLNASPSESILSSELEMKQLSSVLVLILGNPINPSEAKITDQVVSKNNRDQTLMHNQAVPLNSLFKNYQLYLNNNLVELTLNTSNLSKQQTNELQKTIKQWLTNKGYSLKQLIINGVQQ